MVNIRQKDIAKNLGVSRVTVSKALRNHPDISLEMKKKVNLMSKKLGYIPNLIASQLNSRCTHTIGIVVPDLENVWFAYLVDSIIDYASLNNYRVILTVSRENKEIEKSNLENLIGMRVDGLLICISQETTDAKTFRIVGKMGIPLVFFDRAPQNFRASRVIFDDKPGIKMAMERLIAAGYTRIAHFAGYSQTNIGKTRIEGFCESLIEHNLPCRKEWIIEGGFNIKDGYETFKKLYASGDKPEVIITVNNMVALGVYVAARELNVVIPDEIGILGFGFSEHTDLFDPPMTVINQDPRQLGQEAAKMIIDKIKHKSRHQTILLINAPLICRRSVARIN